MPRKPLRPCAQAGCPNLTNRYYCEIHEKQNHRKYNAYKRDKEAEKKYNRSWKKLRELYIAQHPLCEMCQKEGKLTPVDEVHHIIPIKEGGSNTWSNCMSLCHACHMKIHRG